MEIRKKGYLIDTCLHWQDIVKTYLDYFTLNIRKVRLNRTFFINVLKCQNTLGYENMQIKEKPDYSVGALPWASTCASAIVKI